MRSAAQELLERMRIAFTRGAALEVRDYRELVDALGELETRRHLDDDLPHESGALTELVEGALGHTSGSKSLRALLACGWKLNLTLEPEGLTLKGKRP